ncbi:hypothetical protein DPMN_128387 [Dreissena polymorpha]|uniref:Uncharacterized protein n=1 Tax=Dreissena polymorpha TaxID=45954 RepID=A0A9D4H3T2_DREPO|nr:hypothetical protein DPMN_128387 [Dreissena polymorpha]
MLGTFLLSFVDHWSVLCLLEVTAGLSLAFGGNVGDTSPLYWLKIGDCLFESSTVHPLNCHQLLFLSLLRIPRTVLLQASNHSQLVTKLVLRDFWYFGWPPNQSSPSSHQVILSVASIYQFADSCSSLDQSLSLESSFRLYRM